MIHKAVLALVLVVGCSSASSGPAADAGVDAGPTKDASSPTHDASADAQGSDTGTIVHPAEAAAAPCQGGAGDPDTSLVTLADAAITCAEQSCSSAAGSGNGELVPDGGNCIEDNCSAQFLQLQLASSVCYDCVINDLTTAGQTFAATQSACTL